MYIPGIAFCWYPKSIKFIILAWFNALHYNSLAFGCFGCLLDSAGRRSQKFIGSFVMNVSSLAFTCSIEDRSTYIIDMSKWWKEIHEDKCRGWRFFLINNFKNDILDLKTKLETEQKNLIRLYSIMEAFITYWEPHKPCSLHPTYQIVSNSD